MINDFNKSEDILHSNVFNLFVIALIFFFDVITPRGVAVWILYVVPISIVPYKTADRRRIYIISSVATLLVWAGFLIKPALGFDPRIALTNRSFFTLGLWIITYFQVQRSMTYKNLLKYQDDLRKSEDEIRESRLRLLDAQKLARIGYYSVDFKNGGKMEWSDEMYKIWEVDKSGRFPTVEEVWKLVHPDDYEELNRVLTNKSTESDKVETEFRIIFPDSRIKYVQIITRVSFDENGNLARREGIEMDITDRKKVQIELEKTLQKLEKSNQELQQFAYIASHDLQEPLRMVSSYMALLERKYSNELDDKAKEFIHYAVDGSRRMANLIRDLLAFSRLSTQAKEFQQTDLNEVYNNVTRDLQILIRETGAKVESAKLPFIKADATQVHQLLLNLISNAIKFHGEYPPEVNIRAKAIKSGWLFSVKDNGIGIDPQYFDRIFQVFQRLHEQGKYPGTGIGLAVCKKIVERHGGRIWAESDADNGTTFYFTLPDNSTHMHPEGKDVLNLTAMKS